MSTEQPRTWADVAAGRYGIPQDATHFRWKYATAERQKMCDGGRLYDLGEPFDRPGTKPNGIIQIFPYVVTPAPKKGQDDKLTECVVKPGVAGQSAVTWITLEFRKEGTGTDNTAEVLTGLIKDLTEKVTRPQDILIKENERLQARCDEQAKYIAENEGGPVERWLMQNPEVIRDLVKAGLEWGNLIGKALRIKINQMEAEAKSKGYLDVTPKQQ